jgi:syntaxin 16
MILEETEQMVNERDEEITRIARSIEELAQIFKELAVLVIDQGTILDRIDFNMEQVLAHTTEGIQQLQKVSMCCELPWFFLEVQHR